MLEVHGLADVAVRAEVVAPDHVLFFARRGEDDDRQPPGALVLAYPLQDLEAIHFGELQVQQDDLRRRRRVPAGARARAEEDVERLAAVARDDDLLGDVALPEGAEY